MRFWNLLLLAFGAQGSYVPWYHHVYCWMVCESLSIYPQDFKTTSKQCQAKCSCSRVCGGGGRAQWELKTVLGMNRHCTWVSYGNMEFDRGLHWGSSRALELGDFAGTDAIPWVRPWELIAANVDPPAIKNSGLFWSWPILTNWARWYKHYSMVWVQRKGNMQGPTRHLSPVRAREHLFHNHQTTKYLFQM